jgi:3-oxoacyl-[acyl-carrier-protein] synthase-3
MKWTDVFVAASAANIGRREEVADAVAEGRYDPEERIADDYEALRVSDRAPVEMALEAAELAVRRAGLPAGQFDLTVHVSIGYQGMDHWSPAPMIQARVGGGRCPAIEVRQASNGGMAALEITAAYLTVRPAPATALITTSDVYTLPMFDRYRSDRGLLRGDGATSIVLTRGGGGVARLLSTALLTDPTHDAVYRGTQEWGDSYGAHGWPVDLRGRTKEYLSAGVNITEVIESLTQGQSQVMETALADAGVTARDIKRFVFPNAGRTVVDWDYRKREFGIEEADTTWAWGRQTGHMAGGDQIGGLTWLLETKAVHPGDKVVLAGVGAGWSFSAAVLEILEQPDWSASAS